MSGANYLRLVNCVRLLMGADLLVNGLNWWVKLVGPYPSLSDFVGKPPPPDFVGAMIATGFLFHIVKGLELLAGVALLLNRFVPLALVAVFAVSVNVCLVDLFLAHRFRAYVMGTGELLMNVALILAYLEHYRPLLAARAEPTAADAAAPESPFVAVLLALRPWLLGLAAILGFVMIIWVAVLIVQHFGA
jgi:hypothetical protein